MVPRLSSTTPRTSYEFKPSRIVSYYRKGEDFASEYDRVIEAERIINRGSLSTDYPHAGILNTQVCLQRYLTTATNRKRARTWSMRWAPVATTASIDICRTV